MDKQLGTVDGKTFDQWPAWPGKGVPTFGNCDRDNPRQAFLPMFTAMPGIKGAPLLMPTEYFEMLSWRQWVLGARPVEAPQLKWRPPQSIADRWTAQGSWVGLDEPDPPRQTMRHLVDQLPHADRAELADIILAKTGLTGARDQVSVAELAGRLSMPVPDLVTVAASFGLAVTAESFVGRALADRIVAHVGLS